MQEKKITTIIFDLGGVILNLDQEKTARELQKLGLDVEQANETTALFNDFEKGLIHENEFRSGLKHFLQEAVTDEQIDKAWNVMLLDLPAERIDLIKTLKKDYNLLLLSNTNVIHIRDFLNSFNLNFKGENWENLFDKIYYSHEIGLRKPDTTIYEFVLKDRQLGCHECIFIDDNEANIMGASTCGIHTIHALEPFSSKMMAEIEKLVSGTSRK